MTEFALKVIGPLFQLAVLRPGMFLMVFAIVVLSLKVWRHRSKSAKNQGYSLKNCLTYPDDAVLTIGAALMFVVGLLRFLFT